MRARLLVAMVAAVVVLPLPADARIAPQPTGGPLPTDTDVDYQLGGAWDGVPSHVGIVVRDRRAEPLEGRHNVCYVNGFQTQPDERRFWRRHRRLVLKQDGRPVRDAAWGEWLLDLRTPAGGRRWHGSSVGGSSGARGTGSTRWSSTTWTRSPAAVSC